MNANTPKKPVHAKLVVGDGAPVVSVKDHQGDVVTLSSFWKSRPRVLLFVRHFG